MSAVMMKSLLAVILAVVVFCAPAYGAQICKTQNEIPQSTPDIRFTDNGDDTITDSTTGLMWSKCSLGQSGSNCESGQAHSYVWSNALTAASGSQLAGYSDWRIPNIKELSSIVEIQCHSPSVNLTYFPNTQSNIYISSSPYLSEYFFYINFSSGFSERYGRGWNDFTRDRNVRLVRDIGDGGT